jgi:double-stranded uracil-DNA glycosylase
MIRPVERDTVTVYEKRATEWRDRRPARFVERARALGAAVPNGTPRADLGCGAGLHLPYLGHPVVALDAAFAMVELARAGAPDAWCVQADLEHLPFRTDSLGGAWARASYLHIRRDRLPWALMQLHRASRVGAPVALTFRHGAEEGCDASDDFPGRFFADWDAAALADVVTGAGFVVEECALEAEGREWIQVRATRARTLPDYVAPGLRLLICGLNPSVYAADAGVGFARPGNRFWPAALAAGIVARDRDPVHALVHHGVGMTDLVKRATPGAATLRRAEYRDGARRVEGLVRWLRPRVVCFVGLAGWRAAIDPAAVSGVQRHGFGEAPAYVMPNTSGANAHASFDDFVDHLRAVRRLADRTGP